MRKPITPRRHGLIDYGFLVIALVGPSLLGLSGTARVLFAVLGLVQGTLNAFTDHPLALKRIVPFRVHGRLELGGVPVYFLLPILVGAVDETRALVFYLVAGALLLAVFLLTDWKAVDTNA